MMENDVGEEEREREYKGKDSDVERIPRETWKINEAAIKVIVRKKYISSTLPASSSSSPGGACD